MAKVKAMDMARVINSHPKSRQVKGVSKEPIQVVVADSIRPEGIAALSMPLFHVTWANKQNPSKKADLIRQSQVLLVRSETKVDSEMIQQAKGLRLIGRAGTGIDNIDLQAATQAGVVVMNVPGGNTISAAEHTMGLILSLARNIPQANVSTKSGLWERSKFIGSELSGKTLGLIGLGRIGREVARRANSFGMKVLAHDTFVSEDQIKTLGVVAVSLNELLRQSDFISLHTPLTDSTRKFINSKTIALMKRGARLVNCARGGLVDEIALADAVRSGYLRGAALDVFEKEPPGQNHPLFGVEGIIVTPHLGASTEEAQVHVALELSVAVVDYFVRGLVRNAVNLPGLDAESLQRYSPFQKLSHDLGLLLAQIATGGFRDVRLDFQGDFAPPVRENLSRNFLAGFLKPALGDEVNPVNSQILMKESGVSLTETHRSGDDSSFPLLTASVRTDREERKVAGSVLIGGHVRIVHIDGLPLDMPFARKMLVITNIDQPGVIGRVTTLLGSKKFNIDDMRVGRRAKGEGAVMVLAISKSVTDDLIRKMSKLKGITNVKLVEL